MRYKGSPPSCFWCDDGYCRGIVTEMLNSWNHFLLSVAKFIGSIARVEERGNDAVAREGAIRQREEDSERVR